MEIVKHRIKVFDNCLEISLDEGFKDNSIYEIRLKNIQDTKGHIINENITLCTKLSPTFVDIESVKSLMTNIDLSDKTILYNIREASKFALYIKPGIKEDNVPFEASQFVRYKAAHDCLLNYIVSLSTSLGQKGKVGEVEFEEKESSKSLDNLLKHFCGEVTKWTDELKGFKLEGRAKMTTAIKAGKRIPGIDPIGVNFKRGV